MSSHISNIRGGYADRKLKNLVCFIHTHIGGTMTSLVNFLNSLDTDCYDMDVMFSKWRTSVGKGPITLLSHVRWLIIGDGGRRTMIKQLFQSTDYGNEKEITAFDRPIEKLYS